jgi:hypothetical protein
MTRVFYRVDLQVAQNEDLRQAFQLADADGRAVDLAGATLKMDVRRRADNALAFALTLANGRLVVVDAAAGHFRLDVPVAVIAAQTPGAYLHDLVLVKGGETTRVWHGTLHILKGVTQ